VRCACLSSEKVQRSFEVDDLGDGSYQVQWMAVRGQFEIHIKVNDAHGCTHVVGSPLLYEGGEQLPSSTRGGGLSFRKAFAGAAKNMGFSSDRSRKSPPSSNRLDPRSPVASSRSNRSAASGQEPMLQTQQRMRMGTGGLRLQSGATLFDPAATIMEEPLEVREDAEAQAAAAKVQACLRGRNVRVGKAKGPISAQEARRQAAAAKIQARHRKKNKPKEAVASASKALAQVIRPEAIAASVAVATQQIDSFCTRAADALSAFTEIIQGCLRREGCLPHEGVNDRDIFDSPRRVTPPRRSVPKSYTPASSRGRVRNK
jgi:hypothetical protein